MAIVVRPITAARFKDVETLFLTDSVMRSCWDIWPRVVARERTYPTGSTGKDRADANRDMLRRLAARRRAPGLLAYDGKEPIGFISLGPRTEMRRVDASKATPRVDDVPVWVVPCFFVHRKHRGRGVTVALLRAAVEYAGRRGAPAVEGYPRASGAQRVHDISAFFGTADQFRRAGFRVVARPRKDLPKGWAPRYTMRAECAPPARTTRRAG